MKQELAEGAAEARGTAARPWWVLGLLSSSVLLAMSLWFTASAGSHELQEAWGLGPGATGALTTVVQLGFVAGTALAAILNLADIVPSRWYFSVSAAAGAAANLGLLAAPDFVSLLALRFLTGFFLAGVYPPAMKMAATWFRSARGLAIGTIVGALTVGKAIPYLLQARPEGGLAFVVSGSSLAALVGGGAILALYRDGPYPFDRRPFSWGLVGTVARHRPTRLATWGYLGHMWELYALWSAAALFLHDHFALRGSSAPETAGSLAAFAVIAIGGVGAVLAGLGADRWGRERIASWSLVASGACCLVAGWLVGAPTAILLPLCLVWGFAVVADSAQFSALVTEVAPPHAAGTALTLQTSLGFLLTMVTIQTVPVLAAAVGWGWSFMLLAAGPVFGLRAMATLARLRQSRSHQAGSR